VNGFQQVFPGFGFSAAARGYIELRRVGHVQLALFEDLNSELDIHKQLQSSTTVGGCEAGRTGKWTMPQHRSDTGIISHVDAIVG
jgi:hypothetical protein